MISKTDLRTDLINKRKTLNTKELSKLICAKIQNTAVYKKSKNIFAYYPKPYEVDITYLFNDKSKVWFLPKTEGNILKFYEYKAGDKLIKSDFGVFAPENNYAATQKPDLIIVPALSVDKNNYRLGYGKGFYDRFLNAYGNACPKTLTPIFNELIVESLPVENHDRPVEFVISEF